jgi:hypothetical protein
VNRYETIQDNARNGSTAVLASRPLRLDFDLTGNDPFDLEDTASDWVTKIRFGSTATFDALTPSQQESVLAEVYRTYMGPDQSLEQTTRIRPLTLTDVNTIESKGLEMELNYNPTKYWTLSANATKQQAVDTKLSYKIAEYTALRLPWWTTVKVPTTLTSDGQPLANAGANWWTLGTGAAGTGQSPSAFYDASIDSLYALAIANSGKPRPQTREWRFNASSAYSLAGMSENRWLKKMRVGGSVRWEDKAVIGFLAAAPDADGITRRYDATKPVYDHARAYADLFATYTTRFFSEKVRATFQLNVRNIQESGRLQVFGVNPDGSHRDYRIIDPRQFILTATFDL